MSDDKMGQTADLTTAGSTRWDTAAGKRERNFYIALGCAALLHASVLVGFVGREPKVIGDPSGSDDAISVSLVTEQDLQSRSTVAEPPAPPPGQPPTDAQPPQPKPPPPEPQAEQQPPDPKPPETQEPPQEQPQDQPEAKVEPQPPPPVPDAKPDDTKPDEAKVAKSEDQKAEETVQDLLSLPDENPADMMSGTKPKSATKPTPDTSKSNPAKPPTKSSQSKSQKKPQQKRTAALDLSEPDARVSSFTGSGEAAFQRPPGITRSGLNDAFARAVIRALQQSMPQLTDVLGRVQVRILLSENGNVVDVALINGSKNSNLNQNVVFAAKQTSYPIPPAGSNLADRTFLVTYIYD
jgi:TonB family protein